MRLCSWTGLLPLYKPAGLSAAQAVATIRSRILLHQNVSLPAGKHWQLSATCGVGLSDNAEGLLVVALGPAAQQKKLLRGQRHYLVRAMVDVEGARRQKKHVGHVSQDLIQGALEDRFLGTIKQRPAGQKHSHEANILKANCTEVAFPVVSLAVDCSSGTSIPCLVTDLGKALSTVFDVEKIICDRNGQFLLDHALPESEWQPERIFDALQRYWKFWDNASISDKKRRAQSTTQREIANEQRTAEWLVSKGYSVEEYLARRESKEQNKAVPGSSVPREEVDVENKIERGQDDTVRTARTVKERRRQLSQLRQVGKKRTLKEKNSLDTDKGSAEKYSSLRANKTVVAVRDCYSLSSDSAALQPASRLERLAQKVHKRRGFLKDDADDPALSYLDDVHIRERKKKGKKSRLKGKTNQNSVVFEVLSDSPRRSRQFRKKSDADRAEWKSKYGV